MTDLMVQDLHVALGDRPALRGIGAEARSGELLGLIGANGAGKSTLLRAMAGLVRPAAGTVRLDSQDPFAMPPARLALLRAYLPQSPVAHWSLTVGEVVALGRLPHRRAPAGPENGDEAAIGRALARTGTAPFRGRTIDTLSGGERMRVLLARALAVGAPVLLADEPVAALDPRHGLLIMRLLRDLAVEGNTVVAVLHDLTLAARFCHRLLLLHEGQVLAAGPPGAVLTDANLAAAYGVSVQRHGEMVVPWDVISGDVMPGDAED